MVKYTVTGSKVIFGAGFVLGLTDEQAKTRKHQLKKDGKYYRSLENIEFKKDEIIDVITQNLSKATLKCIELFNKAQIKAKPKTKDEKKETEQDIDLDPQEDLEENSETDEDLDNQNNSEFKTNPQENNPNV